MPTAATLRFLSELGRNNNRAWFARNRVAYEAAKADMVSAVDNLISGIARFDPPIVQNDPAGALFRINRDTRFSRDKQPYKTNFGAFLTDRGDRKISRAGYYLHVEPRSCLLAGGLYMPPAAELRAVRAGIERNARSLRAIIRSKEFVKNFGSALPGIRVKTTPRGIPRNHPDLDLLQLKSFEVVHEIKDSILLSPSFNSYALRVFKSMKPFILWINAALDAQAKGQS